MNAPRGVSVAAAPLGAAASWRVRLASPDEPLYTMAVVTELLGTNPHTLRRLENALDHSSSRPSGNQRRYSRRDIELLGAACDLASRGFSPANVARLLLEPNLAGSTD